jgi:hypothetical protein
MAEVAYNINEMAYKLAQLKKKLEEIEKKKIEAETELRLIEQQFNKYDEELKALGIDDINDLPELMKQAAEEIESGTEALETAVTELETKLKTA